MLRNSVHMPQRAAQPDPRAKVGSAERSDKRSRKQNLSARGEPFLWGFGGALVFGIFMIFGFLVLVIWNGGRAFYPQPIYLAAL